MTAPARYDVTITDGAVAEIHRGETYIGRNRLVDFAWRHGLRVIVVPAETRTRGGGTYR